MQGAVQGEGFKRCAVLENDEGDRSESAMGKKLKKKAAKAAAKAVALEREEAAPGLEGRDASLDFGASQAGVLPGEQAEDDAASSEAAQDPATQGGSVQSEPDAAADDSCPASEGPAAAGSCCSCRHKETERTSALQSDVQKRLNRVIGQLNGVKAMIEDNRYCGDVLIQLAASEAAVHRISEIILQDHMETCVVEQIREGNVGVVDEAMKLIKKFM